MFTKLILTYFQMDRHHRKGPQMVIWTNNFGEILNFLKTPQEIPRIDGSYTPISSYWWLTNSLQKPTHHWSVAYVSYLFLFQSTSFGPFSIRLPFGHDPTLSSIWVEHRYPQSFFFRLWFYCCVTAVETTSYAWSPTNDCDQWLWSMIVINDCDQWLWSMIVII